MKRLIVFFLVLLLLCAGAGAWFYMGVDRPFKGYEGAEQFVEISQGSGSVAIARRLADAGVVHGVNDFRLALWVTGAARRAARRSRGAATRMCRGRGNPRGPS